MRVRALGDSGIRVSEVALGCWGFAGGSMWGPQDEDDSIATVSAALEAGVNFFETAQGYGDGYSEEVLGRALAGRRQQAVIATKIRPVDTTVKGIEIACEQSLRRLETDYIDLLQPHWPNRDLCAEETLEAYARLRQAGKIRAFGVSNYGLNDLSAILLHGKIASNQLPYSLLFRAIEYEVQPLCVNEKISILCYSTLLHGLLAGNFASPADVPDGRARTRHFSKNRPHTRHGEEGCELEVFDTIEQIRQVAAGIHQPLPLVAVSWVLHQPGVASVIVGARQPQQIRQMASVVDVCLDQETLEKLADITQPVKQILGNNPDMWLSGSRFR